MYKENVDLLHLLADYLNLHNSQEVTTYVLAFSVEIAKSYYGLYCNNMISAAKNKLMRLLFVIVTSLVAVNAQLLVIEGIENIGLVKPVEEYMPCIHKNCPYAESKEYNEKYPDYVVKDFQTKLNILGYLQDITGIVDDFYIEAICNFQGDNNLVIDGKLGPITEKRLQELFEDKAK